VALDLHMMRRGQSQNCQGRGNTCRQPEPAAGTEYLECDAAGQFDS